MSWMRLKFAALVGCQLWENSLSVTNPVYFVPVWGGENLAWHQMPLNRFFPKQRQKNGRPSSALLLLTLRFLLDKLIVFHIFVKSTVCIWPCCHGFTPCMRQDMCLLYILWDAKKREGGQDCWFPLVPHSRVCIFDVGQLSAPVLWEMLRVGGHMTGCMKV